MASKNFLNFIKLITAVLKNQNFVFWGGGGPLLLKLSPSAMAEHSADLGHHIQFHSTSIVANKTQYMDRIV